MFASKSKSETSNQVNNNAGSAQFQKADAFLNIGYVKGNGGNGQIGGIGLYENKEFDKALMDLEDTGDLLFTFEVADSSADLDIQMEDGSVETITPEYNSNSKYIGFLNVGIVLEGDEIFNVGGIGLKASNPVHRHIVERGNVDGIQLITGIRKAQVTGRTFKFAKSH